MLFLHGELRRPNVGRSTCSFRRPVFLWTSSWVSPPVRGDVADGHQSDARGKMRVAEQYTSLSSIPNKKNSMVKNTQNFKMRR